MLWKLIKYDFRSMMKQFALVWPAALIIGFINRLVLPKSDGKIMGDPNWVGVISLIAFAGIIVAMFVLVVVFIVNRFNKGLLGNEGYLMHTLPVAPWQLITSKLLSAMASVFVTVVVAIATSMILVSLSFQEIGFAEIFQLLIYLFSNGQNILQLSGQIFIMLITLMEGILLAYFSMAIGHLFSRGRVAMSIVAFAVISTITNSLYLNGVEDQISTSLHVAGNTVKMAEPNISWVYLLSILIPCAIYFAGTSLILKKRLNLE